MILEKTCVWLAIFIMFEGVTRTDEQHIIQNTTAKKRYPVLEKLLEFDLDLTNLSDSSLSSLAAAE